PRKRRAPRLDAVAVVQLRQIRNQLCHHADLAVSLMVVKRTFRKLCRKRISASLPPCASCGSSAHLRRTGRLGPQPGIPNPTLAGLVGSPLSTPPQRTPAAGRVALPPRARPLLLRSPPRTGARSR